MQLASQLEQDLELAVDLDEIPRTQSQLELTVSAPITRKRKRVQEKEPPLQLGEGKRRSLRNSIIATRLVNSEKLGERTEKEKESLLCLLQSLFPPQESRKLLLHSPKKAPLQRRTQQRRFSEKINFKTTERDFLKKPDAKILLSPLVKIVHHIKRERSSRLSAFIMHQSKKTPLQQTRERRDPELRPIQNLQSFQIHIRCRESQPPLKNQLPQYMSHW